MKGNNFIIFFKNCMITFFCIFLSTSAFAINVYDVIDLGTLDGKFSKVTPVAINEMGQIVGLGYWDDLTGISHFQGFIWDSTNGMKDMQGFDDYNFFPNDINDNGQVVGYMDLPDRYAFYWENGVVYNLGNGYAHGINNLGEVVGGSPQFIWDKTNGRTNPFGSGDIRPARINDLGQVVGTATNPSGVLQAFIWDTANGFQFIEMPTETQLSVGTDINEFYQISGDGRSIFEPNLHHSYIWEGTNVISGLGDLGGNQEWTAAINDKGQIVGNATTPDFMKIPTGFIWDEVNGMQNINDLILSKEGFEYMSSATDINNSGQIVARGYIDEENGVWHAFLLTPIPKNITVITPNGEEELSAGDTFEINWSSEGDVENLKIEYSVNNGTDWIEIVSSTENDGSYYWEVPNNPSNECLVKISGVDGNLYDESDAFFTITPPICRADFDDDKFVDDIDLNIFLIAMGEIDCTWWPILCVCDTDNDDDVDATDLAVLVAEFGRSDCP